MTISGGEPTQYDKLSLDESIEVTKLSLVTSLREIPGLSLDFITNAILIRPPFQFVHTLVKLFVEGLSFAEGLYNENELDLSVTFSRQEKIRFLVKILACVASVTNERIDIFVSPAKVIAGQEVQSTHSFLRCMSQASLTSPKISMNAATAILKIGETTLYKRLVRTRNSVVKIQAIIRKKNVQKRVLKDCTSAQGNSKQIIICNDSFRSRPMLQESDSGKKQAGFSTRTCDNKKYSSPARPQSTRSTHKNGLVEPISPDTSFEDTDEIDSPCKTDNIDDIQEAFSSGNGHISASDRGITVSPDINVVDRELGSKNDSEKSQDCKLVNDCTSGNRIQQKKRISQFEPEKCKTSKNVQEGDEDESQHKDLQTISKSFKEDHVRINSNIKQSVFQPKDNVSYSTKKKNNNLYPKACKTCGKLSIENDTRKKQTKTKSRTQEQKMASLSAMMQRDTNMKLSRLFHCGDVQNSDLTHILPRPLDHDLQITRCPRSAPGSLLPLTKERGCDFQSTFWLTNEREEVNNEKNNLPSWSLQNLNTNAGMNPSAAMMEKRDLSTYKAFKIEQKAHLRKLQEQEAKLKKRIEEVNQREEGLNLQEIRVSNLARSLRKKEEKLRKMEREKIMELDRLRLESSKVPTSTHSTFIVCPSGSNESPRNMRGNITNTDLRLRLEDRERKLKRRERRVRKIEKELRIQIAEVEDEKQRKISLHPSHDHQKALSTKSTKNPIENKCMDVSIFIDRKNDSSKNTTIQQTPRKKKENLKRPLASRKTENGKENGKKENSHSDCISDNAPTPALRKVARNALDFMSENENVKTKSSTMKSISSNGKRRTSSFLKPNSNKCPDDEQTSRTLSRKKSVMLQRRKLGNKDSHGSSSESLPIQGLAKYQDHYEELGKQQQMLILPGVDEWL